MLYVSHFDKMSEFREASAAVDALEVRLALLREPLQQQEEDGDVFEAKEQALRLLLVCVMHRIASYSLHNLLDLLRSSSLKLLF